MNKKEIKKVTNSGLITAYVTAYSLRDANWLQGRGVERLNKQCKVLEAELVARGLLTEEDVEYLNRYGSCTTREHKALCETADVSENLSQEKFEEIQANAEKIWKKAVDEFDKNFLSVGRN